MARYNRRDLFRHWIHKDQPANRPCTHACCRGFRAHPEHYPVARRNDYLRYSSDTELAEFFGRQRDDDRGQAARDQVIAEMQRRDQADERRQQAEQRRRLRYAARRTERAAELDRLWLEAEAGTKGNMLNRRGREAGINERTLFTGTEARARKYASEELLEWWEHHPRPTEAYFEGRDTRIGYGARVGVRGRMTSEEADWRDRYARDVDTWPIESAA
jgi:hypothetical protein